MCTLILTGKAAVLAGKDGFQSDAGPWTVLAADALVEDEGTYKPDFSAHAGSEHMRCVRISKASFDTVMSLSRHGEEQETHEISSEVKVDILDISESNGLDISKSNGLDISESNGLDMSESNGGGGGSSRSVGNSDSGALSESDRKSPDPGSDPLA
ncbi:unnamed protein product [Laminaria digitata]